MNLVLSIEPLNLAQTLGCGQTFRWRMASDGSWTGPLNDHLVVLKKDGPRLLVTARPGGPQVEGLVKEHLRAEDNVNHIQASLRKADPVLAKGMKEMRGLRIVKMDEWECILSFVLATYANIPRISGMIETLAARYGRPITEGVNQFPTRERLVHAGKAELERCGLGYRASYVHSLVSGLTNDAIESMKEMDYPRLRRALIELPGVGEKVADCVSLFGFGKLEAFPIDVWIERALGRLYGQKGTYKRLREFARDRFGQYAGYAQEYLYYNERAHEPDGACLFSKE